MYTKRLNERSQFLVSGRCYWHPWVLTIKKLLQIVTLCMMFTSSHSGTYKTDIRSFEQNSKFVKSDIYKCIRMCYLHQYRKINYKINNYYFNFSIALECFQGHFGSQEEHIMSEIFIRLSFYLYKYFCVPC